MKSQEKTQTDFETTKTAFVLFNLLIGRRSKVSKLILKDQPNYFAILQTTFKERAKLCQKKKLSPIERELIKALTDLSEKTVNQIVFESMA